MFEWITGLVQDLGYAGVGLLMLLENVFPPLPSELIMPLAGFVADRGQMNFWGAVAAGSVGSLAGAMAWYAVGRAVGERRLRAWIDRHGMWLTLDCEDIDRAADWFRRHGAVAVLVGRLVPTVRTFISVPAGFERMPVATFVLFSAIGTVAWTVALAYAGRVLGANYTAVQGYLEPVTWVILGGFAVLLVYRAIRQYRARRAERSAT